MRYETLKRVQGDSERIFIFTFNFQLLTLVIAGVAQLVEHNLAKVGVAGSNPVARSINSRQ